ncbi:MAG: hypothetical protein LBE31_04955 [Deltaproteobacteria bacterium]|jgi:nickel transport protein|nr:hypothetical protein [Deltaproteobacteria bacterium]
MILLVLFAMVISSALFSTAALAHSVFIFAWGEGDRICTDSYFTRKSPVRGGQVSIHSPDGQLLDSAATDDQGGVCFSRPNTSTDLIFSVEAGQGHRAEFTLRSEDLPPLTLLGAPLDPEPVGQAKSPATAGIASVPAEPTATDLTESGLSPLVIRKIVREEISAQIGPLMKMLTLSEGDKTPGVREIVGGLGWFVGIFGFSFWLSTRSNRKRKTRS